MQSRTNHAAGQDNGWADERGVVMVTLMTVATMTTSTMNIRNSGACIRRTIYSMVYGGTVLAWLTSSFQPVQYYNSACEVTYSTFLENLSTFLDVQYSSPLHSAFKITLRYSTSVYSPVPW